MLIVTRIIAYISLTSTHINRHTQVVLPDHHLGSQLQYETLLIQSCLLCPRHITRTFASWGRHTVHRSPGLRAHMYCKLCIAVGILRNRVRAYTCSMRCMKKSLWLWSVEAAPATKHTQTSACAPRWVGGTCDITPISWWIDCAWIVSWDLETASALAAHLVYRLHAEIKHCRMRSAMRRSSLSSGRWENERKPIRDSEAFFIVSTPTSSPSSGMPSSSNLMLVSTVAQGLSKITYMWVCTCKKCRMIESASLPGLLMDKLSNIWTKKR